MNEKLLLLPNFSPPPLSSSIKKMNRYDLMQILDEKNDTLCLSKRQSTTSSAISLAIALSKEQSNNNNNNNNNNKNDNSNNLFDLFGGGIVYQQNTNTITTRNIENNNNRYEKRKFNNNDNNNDNDNDHNMNPMMKERLPLESLMTNRTFTNNLKSKSSLSSLLAPLNEKEKKEMNNEIKKAKKSHNEEVKSSSSSSLIQQNHHQHQHQNLSTKSSLISTKSSTSTTTKFQHQSKILKDNTNNMQEKENNNNDNHNTTNTTNNSNSNKERDYEGIENFCRYAGRTVERLELLAQKVSDSKRVSVALLWKGLTSNHATSTVSYCTPKSQCSVWHCKCDKQVRANIAPVPLIGVIFSLANEDFSYFLPLAYSKDGTNDDNCFTIPLPSDTTITQRWETFNSIMNNEKVEKIVYNANLYQFPLVHKGISISMNSFFDCKIAAHLLDSDAAEESLELDNIFIKYNVNVKTNEYSKLGVVANSINHLHRELKALLELGEVLREKLESLQMIKCLKYIEMPLTTLLTKMELLGITIDVDHFEKISSQVDKLIKSITTEARALVGQNIATGFNLASPEQVAHVLYETLKLPTPNYRPKQRHFSTGNEELNLIKHKHPIVSMILNHRIVAKIKSTYIDPYRNFMKGSNTTIHATFNQTSTRTGRLSCCKPNLQQIPKFQSLTIENVSSSIIKSDDQLRDLQLKLGLPMDHYDEVTEPERHEFALRSMFVARKGSILVSFDYSQIEMRVFAHACQDTKLKEVFNSQGDIYIILASYLFKKSVELVSDDERDKAKTVCLGQVYGMSYEAAAQKLQITVVEAKRVYDLFFNTFSSVKQWSEHQIARASKDGFVKTISGRRRYLGDIRSSDFNSRSQASRQAVNTAIQGSSADVLKLAMVVIDDDFKSLLRKDLIPTLLLQIHDELIYEVPVPNMDSLTMPEIISKCQPVINIIKNCMENKVREQFKIGVPLVANVTIGLNWGQMQ